MNLFRIEGAVVCTVAHPDALDPAVVRNHIATTYRDARDEHRTYLGMEGYTPTDDVFEKMNSSFWLNKLLTKRYGYFDDAAAILQALDRGDPCTAVTVDTVH